MQAAADELARLDPKPGLKYSQQSDGYIIPDLIVEKIDDRTRSSSTTPACRGSG